MLILGGTTEARLLAQKLAVRFGVTVTLSLAGRTEQPLHQAVPVRSGGFGGAEGLAHWLREKGVDLLIDATHPFASRISANAQSAAMATGIGLITLRRPQWVQQPGDRWHDVDSVAAAVPLLGEKRTRVFLAIGRQEAHMFEAAPQHDYLVRSVDPVVPPLALPRVRTVLARGPFALEDEIALLQQHHIDCIVAKNSGGSATYGKIEAARQLGIEVIMVARKGITGGKVAGTVDEALALIDHVFFPDRWDSP